MSHVDDGTLHAYLDGELSPVERARVEGHLAECDSCRARRDEERGLIERADRLLGLAALPSGHVNRPLPEPHVAPRRRPRYVVTGVWAASIAAAFLAGWLLRPAPATRAENAGEVRVAADQPLVPAAPAPVADNALRPETHQRQSLTPARRAEPATLQENRIDSVARPTVTPEMAGKVAQPTLRGAAPSPAAPTAVAIVPPSASLYRSEAADASIGTRWVAISSAPARRMLGTEPVSIPGLPVRDMLQNPLQPGEVMIEQEVAAGTVIQLLQSRIDTAMAAPGYAGEPLQRTVGQLQVRISGPLSTDSLLKLLLLAR